MKMYCVRKDLCIHGFFNMGCHFEKALSSMATFSVDGIGEQKLMKIVELFLHISLRRAFDIIMIDLDVISNFGC